MILNWIYNLLWHVSAQIKFSAQAEARSTVMHSIQDFFVRSSCCEFFFGFIDSHSHSILHAMPQLTAFLSRQQPSRRIASAVEHPMFHYNTTTTTIKKVVGRIVNLSFFFHSLINRENSERTLFSFSFLQCIQFPHVNTYESGQCGDNVRSLIQTSCFFVCFITRRLFSCVWIWYGKTDHVWSRCCSHRSSVISRSPFTVVSTLALVTRLQLWVSTIGCENTLLECLPFIEWNFVCYFRTQQNATGWK